MRCEPNRPSTVAVIETTLPRASTITKWLVPVPMPVASRPRGTAPGGLPGSTRAIARSGVIAAARERR